MGRVRYLWFFLLLRMSIVAALYVPDSRFSHRLVNPLELCAFAADEFRSWDEAELPKKMKPLYKRSPSILSTHRLQARLLDESTENKGLVAALERIYQHDVVVSEKMMQDSISNLGELTDIRRMLGKLVRGEAVKIVAIGGSVTIGHGPHKPENTYLNQFYRWINQTFPHPRHQLLNKAISATTSTYFSFCVDELVPDDTDLLLTEFTFNDSSFSKKLGDATPRALERLMRKILRRRQRPAIVYVHYWAGRVLGHNFSQDSVEDADNILLKFYGLMGISMRDALHQPWNEDEEFVKGLFLPPSSKDPVHPTCIGSRYLADLLIAHFQDLAMAEVVFPDTGSERIYPTGIGEPLNDVTLLGPPLQKENWGNLTEKCILDPEGVKALVTQQQGFEWTDERRGKWGFVGTEPGSRLEVDVPVAGLTGEHTIGLGFLTSYQHMGMARLECLAGCECKSQTYSFGVSYNVSFNAWYPAHVSFLQEATSCKMGVTILDRTLCVPPEYKVKLTSAMISGHKSFILPQWMYCEDCQQ